MRPVAVVLAFVFLAAGPAMATPIAFDITAQLADGSDITGTVTIDPDAGIATAADLLVGAPDSLELTFINGQGSFTPGVEQIDIGAAAGFGSVPSFALLLPVGNLLGYSGGDICSASNPCMGIRSVFVREDRSVSDAATGSVSSVAEPAEPLLIATALVGLIFRRRARGGQRR